jgi:succinyl-CoA synthetase beta subunit
VASQEQYHSARGLVKAFWEENLSIPAVVRLGGNGEDEAVRILTEYTKSLPGKVEGYKKDDTADFCAERLKTLIEAQRDKTAKRSVGTPSAPKTVAKEPYTFNTPTGSITFDHAVCRICNSKACIHTCVPQILKEEDGVAVLNISKDDAKAGKCIECLACEVECKIGGAGGGQVHLPIAGLDEYRMRAMNT